MPMITPIPWTTILSHGANAQTRTKSSIPDLLGCSHEPLRAGKLKSVHAVAFNLFLIIPRAMIPKAANGDGVNV